MRIACENVNEGLINAVYAIKSYGIPHDSRNGPTLVYPEPVMIKFKFPSHNAMTLKSRDANPFFHIMESIWMLAGRNDVGFPATFSKNIANYSDDGYIFNAAYGHRLRRHFKIDQLSEVVRELSIDPNSRRAVALLWTPEDLCKETKDKACNLELLFSIEDDKLNMTVFNRSNDIIYGTFGANAVHMSMIMMYVAAKLHLSLGQYCQISNNLHAYTTDVEGAIFDRILRSDEEVCYPFASHIDVSYFDQHIDSDIEEFFRLWDSRIGTTPARVFNYDYESKLFNYLVMPIFELWMKYKIHGKSAIHEKDYDSIVPEDWQAACRIWINNRSR